MGFGLMMAAAFFLSMPSTNLNTDAVQFEDPTIRGAPFETETSRISMVYRGKWADTESNCHAKLDRGVQAEIGLYAIGARRVKRAWAYSDYPAMIVEVKGQGGDQETVFLDLSLNRKFISIDGGGYQSVILQKCHSLSAQGAGTGPSSWKAQALGACEVKNFPDFFEAFIASRLVQGKYTAPKVRIVRPEKSRAVAKDQYWRLLPFQSANLGETEYPPRSYFVTDNGVARVSVDIVELSSGHYRVDWSRAAFDESGAVDRTYGLPGWLLFERRQRCWQLVEDGLRFDAAM
jgi:hypothetical protein